MFSGMALLLEIRYLLDRNTVRTVYYYLASFLSQKILPILTSQHTPIDRTRNTILLVLLARLLVY